MSSRFVAARLLPLRWRRARNIGRALRAGAVVACLALALPATGKAGGEFLSVSPTYIPNFFGGGIGGLPDYVGSNDYRFGGAPFGRASWGQRYIDLEANFLTINVIEDRNWRFGPAGQWLFGRSDVDDPVVSRLPDVDGTIELGAFIAYEIVPGEDPRNRWRFSADVTHDVAGEHDGFQISASVRKWFPVNQFAALGVSLGATYGSSDFTKTFFSVSPAAAAASGLKPFDADGGIRDVRTTVVFVQPLSPSWHVGAGVMYKRLLGDAADSPIVDDRGSPNQLIFGIGGAYAF